MTLNMVHHRLSCPGASIFSWKNLSKAAHDGAHEGVRPKSEQSIFQVCYRPEPGDCLALPVSALIHAGDKAGQSLSCGRPWALPRVIPRAEVIPTAGHNSGKQHSH